MRKYGSEYVNINDKGFCHGSSGVMYIYGKLFCYYEQDNFADAKEYWLNQVLTDKELTLIDLYAYAYKGGSSVYVPDHGLVSGYVGIGLSLLSVMNNEYGNWDQLFML